MDTPETKIQANLLKKIETSKIQKIKEIPKGFSFELYLQKEKKFLIIVPESGVFLSDKDYDASELSSLGKILREKLVSEKILSVRQHDDDRIIEIETQHFFVFLEFFRDGNIILAKKPDKKIIIAKEMRNWRHRIIKPNHEYKYPPPPKYKQPTDISILSDRLEEVNNKLKREYENLFTQYKSADTQKKQEKLQRIKSSQLLKLKELAQEKSILEGYVDSIYLKYTDYEAQLEKVKEKQKYGIAEVLGIPLDVKKSLNDNIQYFFKKLKQLKKKIENVGKSIEETVLIETQVKSVTNEKQVKREWYENFRWFISSDGFLVIGGKDAKSNEQLIRKHMKSEDLVFHTDITGSPFVLVKNPNNKMIPEKTIEEAAQFCATYSKAWKIGISIADVYYIKPEQVKKEGGLPTGSFMIYGKRNWVRRIQLELTIGILDGKIIAGPKTAIFKKTNDYFLIIPSEDNFRVPAKFEQFSNEILRLIPYGKGSIQEKHFEKK